MLMHAEFSEPLDSLFRYVLCVYLILSISKLFCYWFMLHMFCTDLYIS